MTTLNVPEIDQTACEAFGNRLLELLNGSALAMMTSIGHRTGLFDAMAPLPPATSELIAAQAGLQERYVREWLGAMVTGRIINYDPRNRTYELPAEHAALLTRAAAPNNFAAAMQFISVLGEVETAVVDKFRNGGGVHYCEYSRFHEVMAEESGQTVVAALEDHILPLVPGLKEKLQKGIKVLDVGCGSGRAMCHLAATYPNSRFAGYDLCEDAVAAARKEAADMQLTNVTFETRDVSKLTDQEQYDVITGFDIVHDQAKPDIVLTCIYNALKDNGTFLMQDIRSSSYLEKNMDHPIGPYLYTISTMHCMTVSLAQNGKGLGTCWGEELALDMLRDTGFRDVKVHTLDHDFINNYYIVTK